MRNLLFVIAVASTGCSVAVDLDGYAGGTKPDASVDAKVDSAADVSVDAVVDSGADGAIDSTVDSTADTSVDTGVDTGDASTDTAIDGSTDAATDSATDTAVDSATDATTDAPLGCHPVVNEVKIAGATSGDEFVELYNPCSAAIPLTGWKIVYRSASGSTDTLVADLSALTIEANGYVLAAHASCTGCGTPDVGFASSSGTGTLSGSGGGLGLRDATATLVDSVGYGTATNAFVETTKIGAPPSNSSIARTPNGTDTDDNSADFTIVAAPTPKAAN